MVCLPEEGFVFCWQPLVVAFLWVQLDLVAGYVAQELPCGAIVEDPRHVEDGGGVGDVEADWGSEVLRVVMVGKG